MNAHSVASTGSSFNRNIVECKVVRGWNTGICFIVLIETLWNVKLRDWFGTEEAVNVLIETLWNVKRFCDKERLESLKRFNRNIVECKVLYPRGESENSRVLIETLWNVK